MVENKKLLVAEELRKQTGGGAAMQDNYCLSVGCIVRRRDEVLLVRHTYGGAKGKLLIPGGYCNVGELPEEAACREVLEETKVTAKVNAMLGIRCNRKTWYALMVMDYIEGEPESDHNENSEVVFVNVEEALERDDVTHMTKVALRALLDKRDNLLFPDAEYRQIRGDDYELYI